MWTSSTRVGTVGALVLLASVPFVACARSPDRPATAVSAYKAPAAFALDERQISRAVKGLPKSSAQRRPLQDGRVSREEMMVAWKELKACVQADGLSVSGPYLNPITGTDYLYTYLRPGATRVPSQRGAAADDAMVERCEDTYWLPLSQIFSANTPQRMSDVLARFMEGCMKDAGELTEHITTFDEIVRDANGQVTQARLAKANQCLDRGIPRLFPRLPYFPRP
ncbi:hypothetical protein [Pedococcus sp. 5OH_020]|uniref:hypothetical protein n=1 Tax=Pedococcus sp. 5OH_020 TaxID=2989814 RepID=UPI0022E9E238|nr:hypothetical protein [Pedococcus sp. 5OH_020]